MEQPTVRQLQTSAYARSQHMVCPACQGGRGAAQGHLDENGTMVYTIVTPCPTCQGRKVLEKQPRPGVRPELSDTE